MFKKLTLALALALSPSLALAQATSWPPPAGAIAFLCVFNTVAPTMTTGQVGFVQCDVNGQVKTTGGGGGGSVTQGTIPWADNITQFGGTNVSTGVGAGGAGIPRVTLSNIDPCMSPDIAKSSAAINITSATTTSLVAVSGSTVVYVCGFALTISEVTTTPNTILFEYGTGAACTSPTVLTGAYGGGGVTAGDPIFVSYGGAGSTVFKSAASAGICALTTIGGSASFQGVLTYVQQ